MDGIWAHLLGLNRARIERLDDPDVFTWFSAFLQQLVREGHELPSREEILAGPLGQGWSDQTASLLVAAFEAVRMLGTSTAETVERSESAAPTRSEPD